MGEPADDEAVLTRWMPLGPEIRQPSTSEVVVADKLHLSGVVQITGVINPVQILEAVKLQVKECNHQPHLST